MRSRHVANWESDRFSEVIEQFRVTGSMNDISRANASSEPPKNWCVNQKSKNGNEGGSADLCYPCRCFLLHPDNALRPNNTRLRVDSTVKDVDTNNMRTSWIGVFVPHANHNVRPRMSSNADNSKVSHLMGTTARWTHS